MTALSALFPTSSITAVEPGIFSAPVVPSGDHTSNSPDDRHILERLQERCMASDRHPGRSHGALVSSMMYTHRRDFRRHPWPERPDEQRGSVVG